MAELFQRSYSVQIGAFPVPVARGVVASPADSAEVQQIKITGLRVEFKIEKSLEKEPNKLDLKITNLSVDSRKKLKGKGVPVIVTAGYPGNEAVIFSGESRTIDHVDSGHGEFHTQVKCGDGERAFGFADFRANFAPGAKIADVLRACAKTITLNTGNLEDVLGAGKFRGGATSFDRGYTAAGKSSDILNSLTKSIGYTWSVQDGVLQLLKEGEPAASRVVLLSKDTGMIGSPDHAAPEKKGGKSLLKIKSLLQPQIKCGSKIEVESVNINGQFVVQKLRHDGDSRGQPWYTEVEATPL